jgi:Luciferase
VKIDRLRDAIAAIDGVIEAPSRYKDSLAYWVNGKEIAHFESDDALDIRLTRAVIRAHREVWKASPAVELRPSTSDWITVRTTDAQLVLRMVELAAAAHRARPGQIPAPPRTERR